MMSLKPEVSVSTTVTDVLELLTRAESLLLPASKGTAPMLQLYWMKAFVRHYGKDRQLAFTAAYKHGRLIALIPFQFSRESKELQLSCDETADFTDAFITNEAEDAIETILEYWIDRTASNFLFERLPFNSPVIPRLIQFGYSHNCHAQMKVHEICPYIKINKDEGLNWARYHSSTIIHRYLTKRAFLGKRASVEFIRSYDEFKEVWPILRDIHINRWKEKGITSKYTDPRRIGFIEEICDQAASRRELFVPLLKIDGQIAAFILAFWIEDTVYDWNTAFDPAFKHSSPGALMLYETLRYIETQGVKRYDFLTGCEEHKLLWASHFDGNASLELDL